MSTIDSLITGSDEVLDAATNGPDALIVDRGSEEPEVLTEIARLLPGFSFTHSFDSEGTCHVQMAYSGRSATQAYINTPYNCFRIVLDVESLIQPDASIWVYAPTMASTTHAFLIAARESWSSFDRAASAARREMFEPVSFLVAAWELSDRASGGKAWWRFWK